MPRALYASLLYLATPAVLLHLLWRARRNPGYARHWGERFGFVARPARPGGLWLHAASVGEVLAAAPLLRALRARHPGLAVRVTVNTPTGRAQVERLFDGAVEVSYLPLDLPGAVHRFLHRLRPRVGLIMERELWPNLYAAAEAAAVPLLLVNARLSERSATGYRRWRVLVAPALGRLAGVAAQSEEDARRLAELGATHVACTGNLKFDVEVAEQARDLGARLRAALGAERPVWIAGSTREGEEPQVLESHRCLRARLPGLALILVPRHPERFDAVATLCAQAGFACLRRSSGALPQGDTEVLLGDTLGELTALYAAADLAFVGGSLVELGAHNPLEPAALGLPVLAGPHTWNFAEAYARLIAAGAARPVRDAAELATAAEALLLDEPARRRMGSAAASVVEANRGALLRTVALIERWLEDRTETPA
jgi:3-deoxy-D-manno-octulosonic-acid transferase